MGDPINDVKTLNDFYTYCEANNIDPDVYVKALDDGTTIDPDILNDPIFQAYWQLTYLKLMEIVNPALIQSVYAETGEVNFDDVYARAGDDWNNYLENMVLDSPELLGFGALTDGNPETQESEVFAALDDYYAARGAASTDYIDEEAREMAQEMGYGGMWNWLIGTEEGVISGMNGLMGYYTEYQQMYAELAQGIQDGTIDPEAGGAQLQQLSSSMSVVTTYMQNFQNFLSDIMEQFSNLKKAQSDGQMSIIRNMSGNA